MSEDTSWVFDSLVCFLHGPIWNAPLQTFIEEKSLIFDPNVKQDASNPDYVQIHEEYKNLVDLMLGSFMEELQISPYQFEVACLEGRQSGSGNAFSFHQGLFQQIWAANDIRIFVRMMTQRNVEIQLQALDLIEHRQSSIASEDGATTGDVPDVVLSNGGPDIESAVDQRMEETLIHEAEQEMFATVVDESPIHGTDTEVDAAADKFKRLNLFFDKEQINSADVQARQNYLRAQRDKILSIKKKARAHQLNETVRKNGRPTSAQAAQNILDGGSQNAVSLAAAAGIGEPFEASMQLRRTLAKRLRTEVVNEGESQ